MSKDNFTIRFSYSRISFGLLIAVQEGKFAALLQILSLLTWDEALGDYAGEEDAATFWFNQTMDKIQPAVDEVAKQIEEVNLLAGLMEAKDET